MVFRPRVAESSGKPFGMSREHLEQLWVHRDLSARSRCRLGPSNRYDAPREIHLSPRQPGYFSRAHPGQQRRADECPDRLRTIWRGLAHDGRQKLGFLFGRKSLANVLCALSAFEPSATTATTAFQWPAEFPEFRVDRAARFVSDALRIRNGIAVLLSASRR